MDSINDHFDTEVEESEFSRLTELGLDFPFHILVGEEE